jgi:hypothetical protein
MKINPIVLFVFLNCCLLMAGCGGGNDSASTGTQPTPAATTTTAKTVKLKASGSVASVSGIQVTVTLPTGVTLKSDGEYPSSGTVTFSGAVPADSTLTSRYVQSGSGPSQLTIIIANTRNFSVGEFATLKLDIATGTTLNNSSLTFSGVKLYQSVGSDVTLVPAQDLSVSSEVVQ